MSVAWNEHQAFADALFGFAAALCGDRAAALDITRETLDALARKPEAAELERGKRYCFKEVRRLALKRFPHGPAAAAGGEVPLLDTLRRLPEPARGAAFLFYISDLGGEDIARVLGLGRDELAEALADARTAAAKMTGGAQ